jgi:hypothetical protein
VDIRSSSSHKPSFIWNKQNDTHCHVLISSFAETKNYKAGILLLSILTDPRGYQAENSRRYSTAFSLVQLDSWSSIEKPR